MNTNYDDNIVYTVVVNHEGQHSIWQATLDIPQGWHAVGKTGSKSECLAYIEETWTDMRPMSLRRQMEPASRDT